MYKMVTVVFLPLCILAILIGGLISAFSARKPTRSTAWVSAYLVLVVGVIQLGLVTTWQRIGRPDAAAVSSALLIYNLGNIGVIIGTFYKLKLKYYRALVNIGGLFIAIAMALLLIAARNSRFSMALIEFIVLALIILISMPIGLMLSSRRHKTLKQVVNKRR